MERMKITVFGGAGFLGRRVVQSLLDLGHEVQAASRRPEQGQHRFAASDGPVRFVHADVNDNASVAAAVQGSKAVVNAVSLYVESGSHTFRSVHVEAAARVARLARAAGAERLIHVSGIGSDARSTSPYIRSRGQGEEAVSELFPGATLIRPAVMFGEGDALVVPLAKLLKSLPVFALFGNGSTRLQPAYVGDVAAGMARAVSLRPERYELAGPDILTYQALLDRICDHLGRKPIFIPLPFAAWQALAFLAEMFPRPPITRNQVELMRQDNVASSESNGFQALEIAPKSIGQVLPRILGDAAKA